MQTTSPDLLQALAGSHSPWVQADAWYDGRVSYQNLPVEDWSVVADSTLTVSRSMSLTVRGDDPRLRVSDVDSPLSAHGAEINIKAGVDLGEAGARFVSLGWFRVTDSDSKPTVHRYQPRGDVPPIDVTTGVTAAAAGKDRGHKLAKDRFTTTEFTRALSLHEEVARLCRGIVPVGRHDVDNVAVGRLVYEQDDRLRALDDVAKVGGGRLCLTPDGEAVLRPRVGTGDLWVLPEMHLVDVEEHSTDDGFYNGVVVRGTNGAAKIEHFEPERDGPLRWDGPAGRVPYFFESPLLTTAPMVYKAAQTTLADIILRRQSLIRMTTVSNPALEEYDRIRWSYAGHTYEGVVKRVEWRWRRLMVVDVWVPLSVARRHA